MNVKMKRDEHAMPDKLRVYGRFSVNEKNGLGWFTFNSSYIVCVEEDVVSRVYLNNGWVFVVDCYAEDEHNDKELAAQSRAAIGQWTHAYCGD